MSVQFSIIIPIAPDRNAPVIDSLRKMDYPKEKFEIITKKGKNPSRNRNLGALKAKGKFLVFLDDDAFVSKNWLSEAEKIVDDWDVVGGPNLTPPNSTVFQRACGYALSSFFGCFKMSDRYTVRERCFEADEINLTSANLFVKKEVFERVGGFDEDLFPNEENDWLKRASKLDLKIGYSPKIPIFHQRRSTISGFSKQFFRSGKGRAIMFKKDLRMNPVFFLPSLFLIYLVILPISGLTRLPLGLYLLSDFIASFWNSIKNKDLFVLPLIMFIYPVLHLSYGAGFLKEIIFGDIV